MSSTVKILSTSLPFAVLILSGFLFRELHPRSGNAIQSKPEISHVHKGATAARVEDDAQPLRVYDTWTQFTEEDGLPSNKVNCVKADGKNVWVGTDKGMALLQEGRIVQVFKTEDGLAHHNVVSLDIDKNTGDLWIGTMSGLNRYSAGRFELFNQFNSGMPNDVVYQVFCIEKYIWVATGGGAGCYDLYTRQWKIFTEQNAPMHEPWTYGISGGDGKVYIAAWGGGIIEYELATGQMRDYTDPDGEMEIDLFPDDGVVHDITTGSSYSDGILWVGTYFGMSRYDGARWKGYFDHDSGLASNFINFTLADGRAVWLCTDNGLSNFNGETWITYRPAGEAGKGEVIVAGKDKKETIFTNSTISHNFIWGMDVQDDIVWLATARGLSRGKASGNIVAKVGF